MHGVAEQDSACIVQNGEAEADDFHIVGNYSEKSNSSISPDPEIGSLPLPDPFAGLPQPNTTGSCLNNKEYEKHRNDRSGHLLRRHKAQEQRKFNPGIYVIKNGDLFFDSNSEATGDGVTFFITGDNSKNCLSRTVRSMPA